MLLARSKSRTGEHLHTLATLIARVAELGCHEEALVSAQSVPALVTGETWAGLASCLPKSIMHRALETVRRIADEYSSGKGAHGAGATFAPEPAARRFGRGAGNDHGLDRADGIDWAGGFRPARPAVTRGRGRCAADPVWLYKARVLVEVATHLSPPDASVSQTALAVTRQIDGDDFRAWELAHSRPTWARP